MPAWPEILSKYNVILSQTHNFSNALLNPYPTSSAAAAAIVAAASGGPGGKDQKQEENIFQKIVLHPNMGMTDMALDMEIAPLLRNQQVMDVLKQENETVKRLSEHMGTRGMMGVLGITSEGTIAPAQQPQQPNGYGAGGGRFGGGGVAAPPPKPEYEDVLKECAEIRDAHDRRVERAVRAVHMLRERYDWKQRVEAAVEEEEVSMWNRDAGMGGGYDEDDHDHEPDHEHGDGKGKESEDDEDDDEDEDEVMGNVEEAGGHDVGADMDEEIEIDNMFVDLEVAPSTPAAPPDTPKPEAGSTGPPPPTPAPNPPPPTQPVGVDDDEPQIIGSNVPEIIDLT